MSWWKFLICWNPPLPKLAPSLPKIKTERKRACVKRGMLANSGIWLWLIALTNTQRERNWTNALHAITLWNASTLSVLTLSDCGSSSTTKRQELVVEPVPQEPMWTVPAQPQLKIEEIWGWLAEESLDDNPKKPKNPIIQKSSLLPFPPKEEPKAALQAESEKSFVLPDGQLVTELHSNVEDRLFHTEGTQHFFANSVQPAFQPPGFQPAYCSHWFSSFSFKSINLFRIFIA